MTFCQRNEYSFLSPVKQRIRDFFAETPESGEFFEKFRFLQIPLVVSTFTAQKSQSVDWLKFHWQRRLDKAKPKSRNKVTAIAFIEASLAKSGWEKKDYGVL